MLQTNQKCYKKKNEKCYKNLAMNYSKIVHSYQIPYESLEASLKDPIIYFGCAWKKYFKKKVSFFYNNHQKSIEINRIYQN